MTESLYNSKQLRTVDRTHNSHRHTVVARAESRRAEPAHAYRGTHRAGNRHNANDARTPAQHRSSRPGRHHTDPGSHRHRR